MEHSITLNAQIVQYLLTGITVGSIYALVALGFNIIYNATGIINFAQGEFVMLGGLVMVFLSTVLRLPSYLGYAPGLLVGFVFSVAIVTAVGGAMERLTIYPLKGAGVVTLIIITIAVSILIKAIAMFVWGKDAYDLPAFSGRTPISFLGAPLYPQSLWVLGITLGVVVLVNQFFKRTILGKAMMACAENPRAASLVGIDVRAMALLAFALSAAIGSVGGIVITPISLMEYDQGALLALKGFGASVLGGLGSFYGAVMAGFILGLIESLFAGVVHSGYKDAAALVVLLLVLFVKPSGIFGNAEISRMKRF